MQGFFSYTEAFKLHHIPGTNLFSNEAERC